MSGETVHLGFVGEAGLNRPETPSWLHTEGLFVLATAESTITLSHLYGPTVKNVALARTAGLVWV